MIIKAKTNKNALSYLMKHVEDKKMGNPKKIALVCIAKNEDNYIQEWVSYNKKLGFDDIFIYQNNWRCSIDEPNVIKIEFDGYAKQVEAYNHFIQNYKHVYEWAAFFDVDEFLVLKKHGNVKDFIEDYPNKNAIAINWVFFGDSGYEKVNGNYNVLERFTMRQFGIDPHVKCIVNTFDINLRMGVHSPINCNWVDSKGRVNSGAFNHSGDDEIVQLNHYFVKTREEFEQKCFRGRADINEKRSVEEFDVTNVNNLEDLGAYNFFKK